MIDLQRQYVFKTSEDFQRAPVNLDSTCFSNNIVGFDGFGHFCNSSHPNSFRRQYREPNCQYVEIGRGMIIVVTKQDIQPGEELLCDYHWLMSSLPGEDFKSDFVRELQHCGECVLNRKQKKQFQKEKEENRAGILLATSELQVQYFRDYFSDSRCLPSADIIDEEVSQYSIQEIMTTIDQEVPSSRANRTFLQLGSKMGFESLMASCYMGNIASSFFVSTCSTSQASKIQASLQAFKELVDSKFSTGMVLLLQDYLGSESSLISAVAPSVLWISSDSRVIRSYAGCCCKQECFY